MTADANNPFLLAAATNSLLVTLIVCAALFFVVLTLVAYLILFERWVAAQIQDRVGPNRAGPFGLLQPLADVFKLFVKEDFTPSFADRWLFFLAPIGSIVPALLGLAVLPLGGRIECAGQTIWLQVASLDLSVLFLLMTGGLGFYGLVVGGWASNSKFSLLGGMRAAAQLLSYEVPAGLVLVSLVLTSGSMSFDAILAAQGGQWFGWLPKWNLFTQPLGFVLFIIVILAECNRLPFDLPEAEQELVGGFHTEFSSMKFGLFFLAEFTNVVVAATAGAVLFLGGWSGFGLAADPPAGVQAEWYFGLLRLAVTLLKTGLIIGLMMQLRWTLPRFRFDQLARLAWKVLVPTSLALLLANAVLVWQSAPAWAFTLANIVVAAIVAAVAIVAPGPVTGRQRTLLQAEEREGEMQNAK